MTYVIALSGVAVCAILDFTGAVQHPAYFFLLGFFTFALMDLTKK